MIIRYLIFIVIATIPFGVGDTSVEEEHGVRYASRCETCKILATELEARLAETGKSHEVLEIGYSINDANKKRKEYRKSELRLIESLENICDRILEYSLHKERKDSTRFAKGMPQTFKALHGLVNRGVKVEMDIPYELWDTPSAEVSKMKQQCEDLLGEHEEIIEKWFFDEMDEEISLKKYLCEDHALPKHDTKCLYEVFQPENNKDTTDKTDDEPKTNKEEL